MIWTPKVGINLIYGFPTAGKSVKLNKETDMTMLNGLFDGVEDMEPDKGAPTLLVIPSSSLTLNEVTSLNPEIELLACVCATMQLLQSVSLDDILVHSLPFILVDKITLPIVAALTNGHVRVLNGQDAPSVASILSLQLSNGRYVERFVVPSTGDSVAKLNKGSAPGLWIVSGCTSDSSSSLSRWVRSSDVDADILEVAKAQAVDDANAASFGNKTQEIGLLGIDPANKFVPEIPGDIDPSLFDGDVN